MSVKKRVLLLDDRIVRENRFQPGAPGKVESRLESFAQRLANRENFDTFAPVAIDDRGFAIAPQSIEEFAKIVRSWIDQFRADGLVIDMDWWNDERYGVKLWQQLCRDGAPIKRECVVFLSIMVGGGVLATIASDNGLDAGQVHMKDTAGFNKAAEWLKENL